MQGKIQVRLLLFVFMVLIALAACQKKEAPSAVKQTAASATSAYEKHFGPPPVTDKGTCYAFVIYFPSAVKLGKIVPFPFFTFDEASMKKVAIERLLGGMDVGSYKKEILQPFAAGTRLLGLTEQGGVITADFTKEILHSRLDETGKKAMLNAITLTLAQFKGVKEVRTLVEGKGSGSIDGVDLGRFLAGTAADENTVLAPSPPRVLGVTAMKEKGEKVAEELDVFFDRPIYIRELQITDKDGKSFEGDVFHSVFDMAAVLKPKDAARFKANMPIKVRWKITDKVGRVAEGESEFPLEIKEH